MKAIHTHDLTPTSILSKTEKDFIYNGLDCCVTLEVLEAIEPQLDNLTRAVYEFEKALQGPILEMNMHGVLVDLEERDRLIAHYNAQITRLEAQLRRLVSDGLGTSLNNWRSPDQIKALLYAYMGLPAVKTRGKVTANRDALEKLEASYLDARPIISHLLLLRDLSKKVGVLKTRIDPDHRIRTSFSIAGTVTGRLASSFSEFGESGSNLQNIEQRLRRIFIADPGMKFAYIDKEQAESRLVGAIEWNLFQDGRYLDACESGDLHTSVCKLAWKDLAWTGDLKADRAVAEQPFYRQHGFRHMAKVLGHGTNYAGQPFTMAQHTKIDRSIISEFQQVYFAAFPAHERWHERVKQDLWSHGNLVSLTGRRRWFFGRRNDPEVQRAAIAFDPQGSVGDILNRDMLNVWRLGICQLLLQVHDAILVQYPEAEEDTILPKILGAMQTPTELAFGRQLIIPNEAKVGWNWAEFDDNNPDGLRKYRGGDERKRSRQPKTSILDRRFY